jgi:hypothetical protein
MTAWMGIVHSLVHQGLYWWCNGWDGSPLACSSLNNEWESDMCNDPSSNITQGNLMCSFTDVET